MSIDDLPRPVDRALLPDTLLEAATARALTRRRLLTGALAGVGVAIAGCGAPGRPSPSPPPPGARAGATADLGALEQGFGGRIGVHALDTAGGATVGRRADERFLLCSTCKVFTVAAVLRLRAARPGLLDQRIHYDRTRVVTYSPVTSTHVADGMTVTQLCEAALTRSDNTAENLLLDLVGGPEGVTGTLRGLGDTVTHLDRTEPDLNRTSPGDPRDTSTPAQVAHNLDNLLLGTWLAADARAMLTGWMRANQTGGGQIRAAAPGWPVADKTGSGYQGETNDIAVLWPPNRAPLVVAVYAAPRDPSSPEAKGHRAIAAATTTALHALGPTA